MVITIKTNCFSRFLFRISIFDTRFGTNNSHEIFIKCPKNLHAIQS